MGKGHGDDKHETSCGVIINCVCLYSGSLDSPMRAAGSSAPCHRQRRVFELGHEARRGSDCSGG